MKNILILSKSTQNELPVLQYCLMNLILMCRLSEGRYLQVRQRLLWAADWYIGH